MAHRQNRTRTIAQCGELVIEADPHRPSGRLMRQGDMDASYIDLANVSHLEFDYMRWLRIVLHAARAQRVLHIGGGGCALARALAAENPRGRQEVCEVDAEVLAVARQHLGLRRTPGLRVRHAEGRRHIAAQLDHSWDAIVIDAFLGARIPPRLITAEALIDAARVAPLTLVNFADSRRRREVTAVASSVAAAYPQVWTLGHRGGNTIIAGCSSADGPNLASIAAQAAADPTPARLTAPKQMAELVKAIPPFSDADLADQDTCLLT